ncbi:hypothetical protein CDAR_309951 [Caerostris darwini]|uniref:Uncharacterized protein n=1 Tax=Caerostris darwini TaxID=1538125 RepID=A0AAV4VXD3_9ARAC|nr:hypothetical protein CDAR_309951 [Caerostris darwini]
MLRMECDQQMAARSPVCFPQFRVTPKQLPVRRPGRRKKKEGGPPLNICVCLVDQFITELFIVTRRVHRVMLFASLNYAFSSTRHTTDILYYFRSLTVFYPRKPFH